MAEVKISELTSATTPLAGTETVPIVQGGVTKQVAVSEIGGGGGAVWGGITGDLFNQTDLQAQLDSKQDYLFSGTNIKTVNSTSLLGSGNVAVQPTLVSGTNIKTINGNSVLGSGDLTISGGGTNPTDTYLPVNSSGTFVDSKIYQQPFGPTVFINSDNVFGVYFYDFGGNNMLQLNGTNGTNTIGWNNGSGSIGVDVFAGSMRIGSGLYFTGTHTTISKWIKVTDESGTTYHIPLYL